MANIFDMADTWNDINTTFTAIKMDVTDSASAADSLLLNLLVGNVSKEKTDKNGNKTLAGALTVTNGSASSTALHGATANAGIFFVTSGGRTFLSQIGLAKFGLQNQKEVIVASDYSFGWSSSTDVTLAFSDVKLFRDAASALAQRNGTNPQVFRLYGTHTDSVNLERLTLNAQAGGRFQIKPEALGTGTLRGLELGAGAIILPNLPTTDPLVAGQVWNDAGTLKVSAG